MTTIVTLLSAYSSYYVADRLVGASGLLAVVMNGFTMSIIGEAAGHTGRCIDTVAAAVTALSRDVDRHWALSQPTTDNNMIML